MTGNSTNVGIASRLFNGRRFRSIATMAGVAMAIAVAIASASLAEGLRILYEDRLLEVGAHVTVTANDARGRRSDLLLDVGAATGAVALGATAEREDRIRIRNVMTVLRTIERQLGNSVRAASPYIATQVLATHGTSQIVLPIKGVVPEREDRLAHLASAMRRGSVARLHATRYGILLGEQASRSLSATVGDRVRVVSMTGEIYNVTVVGIYDLGVSAADQTGIVNLRFAQTIARALPSEGSAIGIQLRNPDNAHSVARRLERTGGRTVVTWDQDNPRTLATLALLRSVLFAIGVIALVLGGFTVAHSVIAAIGEHTTDLALLRSMGATPRRITAIFVWYGAIVSVGATLAGCALGTVLIRLLAGVSAQTASAIFEVESARLPVHWSALIFAGVAMLAIATDVLASFIAARASRRLDVVDILRAPRQ